LLNRKKITQPRTECWVIKLLLLVFRYFSDWREWCVKQACGNRNRKLQSIVIDYIISGNRNRNRNSQLQSNSNRQRLLANETDWFGLPPHPQ